MSWNPLEWYQRSISPASPSTTVGTGGSRSPLRQNMRSDLRPTTNMGGRYTLQQDGPFRVDAPRQSTPQVGPLGGRTNPSGAEARFNKEFPQTQQPKGTQPINMTTKAERVMRQVNSDAATGGRIQRGLDGNNRIGGGGLKNSIAGAVVYAAGDALIPHISREAVRGAIVVTGGDTTDYDRMTAGLPVVRNVGGVSYNIATPEGRSGYQEAIAKGQKPSTPIRRSPTGPSEPGGDYTVAGVTYDGKTHRPKNAPESSYTLEADGSMTPHAPLSAQQPQSAESVEPTRPGDDGTGLNTGATVDLSFDDANNLLSRGGNKENHNRFLASDVQLADVNSFLPAPMPVSGNDSPAKPVDNSQGTELAGDQVAEGVVTQQKPSTISADGADNTRSISVPGEPEGPVNYMEPQKSADAFLRARRAAFLDLNNRGYGAIRAADAAVGRFRQGDKFFYNDAGTMREVDEQTWRKGQHQAINPLDEMEEGSKFMEGWKDSKIKPTLVPSEQTDITNPDADGGRNPQLSDFNDNNVAPITTDVVTEAFAPTMAGSRTGDSPMPAGDGGKTLGNSNVPEVFATHLQRARGKRGS